MREFEIIHDEKINNQPFDKNEYIFRKNNLEYFVMRDNFICPSYLPIVSESILRIDFNFCDYLGRSLAKTFRKIFEFSISSFIIALIYIIFHLVISQLKSHLVVLFKKKKKFKKNLKNNFTNYYFKKKIIFLKIRSLNHLKSLLKVLFLLLFPCGFLIYIYYLNKNHNFLKEMLTQKIDNPSEVFYSNVNLERDPYINFQQIATPNYLKKQLSSLELEKPSFLRYSKKYYQNAFFF